MMNTSVCWNATTLDSNTFQHTAQAMGTHSAQKQIAAIQAMVPSQRNCWKFCVVVTESLKRFGLEFYFFLMVLMGYICLKLLCRWKRWGKRATISLEDYCPIRQVIRGLVMLVSIREGSEVLEHTIASAWATWVKIFHICIWSSSFLAHKLNT